MANVKISGLPAVTSVATTDVIPVVTGGVTSKIGSANFVNSGLSGGTANGVLYLNGSKAATSGSALTFDGTSLTVTAGGSSTPSTSVSTQGIVLGGYGGSATQSIAVYGSTRAEMLIGGNYTGGSTSIGVIKFLYGQKSTTDENAASICTIAAINDSASSTTGGYLSFYTAPTSSTVVERSRISSDGTFRVKGAGTAGSTDAVQFSGSAPANSLALDSSGNLGIGTTANASAILDAQSTTKGVRFPNMTTTQKNAIASPAAGLVVFDTTLAKLCVYSGSAWQTITSV